MTFYGTTATAAGLVVPRKYVTQVGDYRTLRGVGPRMAEHMLDTQHLVPYPAWEEVRMK
jgi:hypothetical protein